MKALFNKKKKLVKQLNEIEVILDEKIIERFGFHYSQTDNDPIIDTLDYGTDDIDYLHFIQLMREFEVRKKRGEWYPNA